MSRHRDIRSMRYSEEYEGYDDIYGHSVEDDYGVSPGVEQFIYDRNKQQNMSSFLSVNNEGESSTYENPELSEMDSAKLMSCIDSIRNIIGKETISDKDLTKKVIDSDFDSESVLNEILNESEDSKDADRTVTDCSSSLSSGTSCRTPTATLNIPKTPAKPVPGRTEWNDRLSPRLESPRSQSPVSERNSPGVRRKEYKRLTNSKSNTPRCQSPNPENDVKSAKSIENTIALYKTQRGEGKEQVHLVVVGHVDAGKSTLLGRLLCDLGQVSSKLIHKYQQESKKIGKQSFMYAWVLDETGEERERGITMDVGYSKFETKTKNVTLLDAPGHKDFIPNMIMGATQADVALLVVDATRGEFETGFDSGGQTREHALLLRSLGISQLAVVVNKLDTVNWSKDRFNEIVEKMNVFLKQVGFRETIPFVPCSGLSGENLASKPKVEGLANWYNGPTLVDVIDNFKCPERAIDKPFRFSINDIFKGTGSGFCVSGHVETGMVSSGDKVLVLPHNETALVRNLQIDEIPTTNGFAGDQVVLTLANFDQQNINIGDVLCNIQNPVPTTTRFEAHIVIFNLKFPITRGLPVIMHQLCLVEPVIIRRLISHLHKSTGEVLKKKPKCLPKNSSAIVEIETQRPICVELYRDVKPLGRIMLRMEGATIAAGLITKIK